MKFPIYGKTKNVRNHQPDVIWVNIKIIGYYMCLLEEVSNPWGSSSWFSRWDCPEQKPSSELGYTMVHYLTSLDSSASAARAVGPSSDKLGMDWPCGSKGSDRAQWPEEPATAVLARGWPVAAGCKLEPNMWRTVVWMVVHHGKWMLMMDNSR